MCHLHVNEAASSARCTNFRRGTEMNCSIGSRKGGTNAEKPAQTILDCLCVLSPAVWFSYSCRAFRKLKMRMHARFLSFFPEIQFLPPVLFRSFLLISHMPHTIPFLFFLVGFSPFQQCPHHYPLQANAALQLMCSLGSSLPTDKTLRP